jgi:pilus assembly protein TadC
MRIPWVALLLGIAIILSGRSPRTRLPGRYGAATTSSAEREGLVRFRWPLVGGAVLSGWILVGGAAGLCAGLVAGAVSWRALDSLPSPAVLRRRREIERDLPFAVHLLGAALAAGTSTSRALSDVADAVAGAVGEELALVGRHLELGVDPVRVYRTMRGPLLPLGRSLARVQESGGSVVAAVDRLAEELRSTARHRRDARARSVEVRAAAPLGLCFLPAFVLVGVVPMIVGLFSSLRLFS